MFEFISILFFPIVKPYDFTIVIAAHLVCWGNWQSIWKFLGGFFHLSKRDMKQYIELIETFWLVIHFPLRPKQGEMYAKCLITHTPILHEANKRSGWY